MVKNHLVEQESPVPDDVKSEPIDFEEDPKRGSKRKRDWHDDLPLSKVKKEVDVIEKDILEDAPPTALVTRGVEQGEQEVGYKERSDIDTIFDIGTGQKSNFVETEAGKVLHSTAKKLLPAITGGHGRRLTRIPTRTSRRLGGRK